MVPLIVVQVVVDKPLAQGFDYLWDAEKLGISPQIGCLVEVPFGRSSLVGMVIKVSAHSDFEKDKLKSVAKLAPLPPFDPAALSLMNFASQYYMVKPSFRQFHKCGKSQRTGKRFHKNS